MGFDTMRFLRDYNVQYSTEHHHCTIGWVQVHCPFCNDNGFHLGMPLQNSRVTNCWRCGKHSLFETIKELLSCSSAEIFKVLETYGAGDVFSHELKEKSHATSFRYPSGTGPMTENHKKYLIARGFNPDELEKEWGLLGTGPIGDYKHRIIIPIYYAGKPVSYTGRDITGRSELRYKTCPSEKEVRSHKHCLYGMDKVTEKSVIVVEGPADVWRMGPGTVATFGITWTREQAILLSRFKKMAIMYDNEPHAHEQAQKLASEVSLLGSDIELIEQQEIKDPGDMRKEDVEKLKKLLQRKDL